MTASNGATARGGLFKLNLEQREPFWLTIVDGVPGLREPIELLVTPYDTREQFAATFESLAMQTSIQGMAERIRAGEDPAQVADSVQRDIEIAAITTAGDRGEQTFDFLLALARRTVLDWRGVGSWNSDEPLPFNQRHLEALLRQSPEAISGFNLRYSRGHDALAQEKKVSENGHAGTADEVLATVPAAENVATPAPSTGSGPTGSVPM